MTDPTTLLAHPRDLYNWLGQQPKGVRYDMGSTTHCVVASYLTAMTGRAWHVGIRSGHTCEGITVIPATFPPWVGRYINALMLHHPSRFTARLHLLLPMLHDRGVR